MTVETLEQHEALVASMMDPERWPEGGTDRYRIDTHISTVVLAGDLAYKIKKPIDLGFLNFATLDARRAACDEEMRLNRPQAPDIYQAVCAVTGSIERPQIDGSGEVIDWAVRMRRFDPDAILSKQLARLDAELIDRLALRVAAFHLAAPICPGDQPFGSADAVFTPMQQNFAQIHDRLGDARDGQLDELARWTYAQHSALAPLLDARKAQGFVRECHGDLHLGNVALIDDQPVLFDAIEFNPALRWIDVISDTAFLTMDLHQRGRCDLKYRFLDRYLQRTGDYPGLKLLRFYEVYRAMVRAKVAAIREQQPMATAARAAVDREFVDYLTLAHDLSRPYRGAIVIMHGVSGSGKSFVAGQLPGALPALRLRSDVERKRLLGIDAHTDATGLGAYSEDLTDQTYARLAEMAEAVVDAGYDAIVDATFLRAAQRQTFRDLAAALQAPFAIIDCDAPEAVLRGRILDRRSEAGNVSDADLAVLADQLRTREPLSDSERSACIPVGVDRPLDLDELRARID